MLLPFIVALCAVSVQSLDEGDVCIFEYNSRGICTFKDHCPIVAELRKYGISPKVCRYVRRKPLICCEDKIDIKSTTLPTTKMEINKTQDITTVTALTVPPEISTKPDRPEAVTTTSTVPAWSDVSGDPMSTSTEESTEMSRNRIPGEISRAQCINYAVFPYGSTIAGGTKAAYQEFPHMALLGYERDKNKNISWECGGSLISENFVLTAAHCLTGRTEPPKFVRFGLTDQTNHSHLQELLVNESIPHPMFKRSQKYHDIGLIRLEKDVKLDISVYPACLHTEKNIPQKSATTTGWGTTDILSADGSNDLLKVDLDIYTNEDCTERYLDLITGPKGFLKRGIIDDLLICAGSPKETKSTCQGDSGGPLQVHYTKNHVEEDIKQFSAYSYVENTNQILETPQVYIKGSYNAAGSRGETLSAIESSPTVSSDSSLLERLTYNITHLILKTLLLDNADENSFGSFYNAGEDEMPTTYQLNNENGALPRIRKYTGSVADAYSNHFPPRKAYKIIGVTSFGRACGLYKDVPGIFARVSNYIPWIEDIVWPE